MEGSDDQVNLVDSLSNKILVRKEDEIKLNGEIIIHPINKLLEQDCPPPPVEPPAVEASSQGTIVL